MLVSAGEASGDAMAAPVLKRLGVEAFGLGGKLSGAAGMEVTTELTKLNAMGFGSVAARAPAIAFALAELVLLARRRKPKAALLVGFSEFNALLGARLRKLGIRVLWYGPPQIWAWRSGRGPRLRRACDRMAVILPFEEELWRSLGVDAHFVGHPALESPRLSREAVRQRVGLTPYAEYVAVLPGSRIHEVKRHLEPMLGAVALLRSERGALDARVVIAPSLEGSIADWVAKTAVDAGVSVLESSAPAVLPAFDVALSASGSVTLECVVADVPPVIVYRAGPLTEAVARRLVHVDSIGLPNIVLGRSVFPELTSTAVVPEALADEAGRLLDERTSFIERCRDVRAALVPPGERTTASERVARLLEPWVA